MNLFVADPHWGWWIILYFYLGGIAAGAYFTATLIELMGRDEDSELARIGYWIAFPLVCLCGLFLTIDLDRPERFWHMLLKSEVVESAFAAGWPFSGAGWRHMSHAIMFKYWSPMSIGAWALMLFGLCSFLSFLGTLWPGGRLERWFRHGWSGRGLQAIGSLVGFFIAAYTGSLLTATNEPVWSDSDWIAPLFLASAASTGIALIIVIAGWRRVAPAALVRLERADLWALGLELAIFAAFLASLGGALLAVLESAHGRVLVVGVLVIGLLVPLALHLRLGVELPARTALVAAGFALVGGFLLRYALLTTTPELLARGPAGVGHFSPEDGRSRGAGSGADPHNYYGDEVAPQSKVFGGD
jgi:formate-dependent nitrite reductase membrane component NrfD